MRTNVPTRAGSASATIAVDLGATSVRVVEVEFGAGAEGAMRVARRGIAPLPPGVWNDLTTHRGALSAAISQALASAGIAGKAVVACMPRRMVTLRFVRLPHAPPDQLRGMVEFEAQQYVLFPLDDVILDYHVVMNPLDAAGVGVDDMDTVLLAAARRSLISDIMHAFDSAGLELQQLSASALALAENGRDSLEVTALIDVEPGEIDVAIIADGQLLFTRASALDVQGVRPEVAERREVEEVVRSFTAYQNEFRHRPIVHVFVGGESGTGSAGESLDRALVEMLEMPVAPLIPRGLAAGDKEGRAWATAIGMALHSRPGSISPISLVPNERAERKARQAKVRRQQLGALAGAAALLAALYFGSVAYGNAQRNEKLAVVENNDLKKNTDLLAKLQKEHDKTKAIADNVLKGLDRNHPAVDILYALNSALPTTADIWLTQFQFDRGGLLTLHGETKSAIAATQLVLALQKSGAFTDVRLGYLGDSQENLPAANQNPPPAPASTATGTSAATTQTATVVMPTLPGPAAPAGAGAPGVSGSNGTSSPLTPRANVPGRVPAAALPAAPAPASAVPAPIIITPSRPAGAPSSRATQLENGFRHTSIQPLKTLSAYQGKLIPAGWGGQDPQNPDPSNPNGNPPGRFRRNRGGNGNFNPNPGTGGLPTPGAQGGTGQGNPGTPQTPPAPYTSGSIFGPAAANPSVPSTSGTGGTNQNDPNNRRFRRFGGGFGGGGFGGGGLPPVNNPVPPVSPPATGIQRTTIAKPIVKPPPRQTAPTKQTLTSFIITCRVNNLRKELIPPNAAAPVSGTDKTAPTKQSQKSARKTTSTGDSGQDEGNDADTQ